LEVFSVNPLKRQFRKTRYYVLSTSILIITSLLFTVCSKNSEQEKPSNPALESKQTAPSKPFKIIPGDGNWPSFRGVHAAGVVDKQNLPESWNGQSGENIIWKTLIPGLAHSSPIIWGDKLFVTTAITSRADASFRHGLYGDGDASNDLSPHRWVVYCLNKNMGEILWERTATEGIPKDKRHIKSTYANSTPATDGRYVIALFGSQGLFTYNLNGDLVWEKDLGRMNCGAYDEPHLEWGPASSPIVYRDMVIIQNDTSEEDFIIACDIKTGETIWKTKRDELPAWGTPTIVESKERTELVTNSSNYIYGYDPKTGNELWRLGGSSKITAPTPIFSDSIIIVCSGRGPEAPIFAIKTGATGNITLEQDRISNESVLWSKTRRGPYMPTPIIYRGYFYTCNNNGRFRCYNLVSGDEIYSEKLPHRGGGFSASPVASDGRLFMPSEDGDIFVVRAGPEYELLSTNDMGELLMALPAISDGKMYIRAENHLFAIGR
jgi:outer membrane protein assembly factor BamB